MSVPVLTHRRDLRQGDLVFPEEILRIGHTLDFQLDCVSKEVQQEVFGPELDTSSPHRNNPLPEFWKEGASVPVSA